MPRISPVHITTQPVIEDISNSFGILGNEDFLYKWTYQTKSCGRTTTFDTALSHVRLLLHSETSGYCTRNREDISIILRDIADIRESRRTHRCCCLLCTCCKNCRPIPKLLEVRGTFGSHRFMIPEEDVSFLQDEMSVLVGNYKFVSHEIKYK
ncbi:hypothetical protein I4U23_023641 [Adineta vaga]|nr:hypothetical protein I4U23_023641 [Adineta vaga]